jgi:hypothetical protein
MHLFSLLMAALFLGPLAQTSSAKEGVPSGNRHPGMSGASAAIFLDAGRVVVASDEDNRLRVYDPSAGQPAITDWDASPWLNLSGRNPECDLEGAARVGSKIYWIGSHGRNKDGKYRSNRHRFFATEVIETPQGPRLRSLGSPCSTLVSALLTTPSLASLHLDAAAALPPDSKGGLNIEALAARPDGSLWIGFRGPLAQGKSILVPLLNPDAALEGQAPRFGSPTRLDLGGRGLRDMAWTGSEWILVAGATGGDQKGTRLFRWNGEGSSPIALDLPGLKNIRIEAVAIPPERPVRRLFLCSDDSNRKSGETPWFRSFWIDLPTLPANSTHPTHPIGH